MVIPLEEVRSPGSVDVGSIRIVSAPVERSDGSSDQRLFRTRLGMALVSCWVVSKGCWVGVAPSKGVSAAGGSGREIPA